MAKEPALEVTLDGVAYRLTPGMFTGQDDLAVYRSCGVTIMDVFARKAITLFTIAALVWRYRVNHGEPDLTFDEVNAKMTFNDLVIAKDAPEGALAPEA